MERCVTILPRGIPDPNASACSRAISTAPMTRSSSGRASEPWSSSTSSTTAEPTTGITVRQILAQLLGALGDATEVRPPLYCEYGYQLQDRRQDVHQLRTRGARRRDDNDRRRRADRAERATPDSDPSGRARAETIQARGGPADHDRRQRVAGGRCDRPSRREHRAEQRRGSGCGGDQRPPGWRRCGWQPGTSRARRGRVAAPDAAHLADQRRHTRRTQGTSKGGEVHEPFISRSRFRRVAFSFPIYRAPRATGTAVSFTCASSTPRTFGSTRPARELAGSRPGRRRGERCSTSGAIPTATSCWPASSDDWTGFTWSWPRPVASVGISPRRSIPV